MPTIITMPAFSSTMESGKLIKWLVNEGDKVKSGQALAEVETDKAVADIEATSDGTLARILISEPDSEIPVNEKMGVILGTNESEEELKGLEFDSEKHADKKDDTAVTDISQKRDSARTDRGNIKTSPGARRAADDAGIDITLVRGSGPKGRITKDDVLQYVEENARNKSSSSPPSGSVPEKSQAPGTAGSSAAISPMRKAIAQRLSEAKREIPHFYIETDIFLDNLLSIRSSAKQGQNGSGLSMNAYFVKAVSLTLENYPVINSSWSGDTIDTNDENNIGLAVAVKEGLVVPVIHNVDRKSLVQINDEINELIELSRSGRLPQSMIGNSSITISNLGMHNINRFYAIINPPESCILALATAAKRPVVIDNGIHIRTVMTCTMSADHRFVDGVTAAGFINSFKNYLENPDDWI